MTAVPVFAWLLYFALAFGYRTYVHFRTTGRSGFVLFRAGSRPLDRAVSALMTLSVFLGFAGACLAQPAGRSAFFAPLFSSLGSGIGAIAALAVYVVGLATTVAAQRAMGPSWRIGVDRAERTELVVSGPFGVVRNPIFTAMLIAGLGLALLVPSPASAAAYLLLVAALELQVRCIEEPHLVRVHGERYLAYASRTGRFVPGLGALRGSARRSQGGGA